MPQHWMQLKLMLVWQMTKLQYNTFEALFQYKVTCLCDFDLFMLLAARSVHNQRCEWYVSEPDFFNHQPVGSIPVNN